MKDSYSTGDIVIIVCDEAIKHHKNDTKKAKLVVIGAINWYDCIDYGAVLLDHVIQKILIILIEIKFKFYDTVELLLFFCFFFSFAVSIVFYLSVFLFTTR